jgi:hypothetical protein
MKKIFLCYIFLDINNKRERIKETREREKRKNTRTREKQQTTYKK